MFFGLAVAVHVASITEIVCADVFDLGRRLGYSLAAAAVLLGIFYYPVYSLIARVAIPQQFLLAAPPFAAGDVILVNPSAFRRSDPQPGDVVSYELPRENVVIPGGPHGTMYRLQGDRVNRVLARPGQHVTSDHGKLLVDGQPSPWLPLTPVQVPDGLNVTLPADRYFIIPSGDMLPPVAALWQAASIVPRNQIHGRVYMQVQPLSKIRTHPLNRTP